jgi:4'-phosphopantetheinyl transferase
VLDNSLETFSDPHPSFSLENRFTLQTNEVHVWRVSLDVPLCIIQRFRQLLASDEEARADRFLFEADRRRFIVARACLRKLLAAYLLIEPGAVRFNYGEYGKPSLAKSINKRQLSFNLAHAGGMALYAFTLKRRIGVDLEYAGSNVPDYEMARKYFSAAEVERLDQLSQSSRPRGFFNCWTRKEAVIKAIGTGLSLPLDQFEVTLAPGEPVALLRTYWDSEEASRWSLIEVEAGADYVAALAVEGHDWKLSTWELDNGVV